MHIIVVTIEEKWQIIFTHLDAKEGAQEKIMTDGQLIPRDRIEELRIMEQYQTRAQMQAKAKFETDVNDLLVESKTLQHAMLVLANVSAPLAISYSNCGKTFTGVVKQGNGNGNGSGSATVDLLTQMEARRADIGRELQQYKCATCSDYAYLSAGGGPHQCWE